MKDQRCTINKFEDDIRQIWLHLSPQTRYIVPILAGTEVQKAVLCAISTPPNQKKSVLCATQNQAIFRALCYYQTKIFSLSGCKENTNRNARGKNVLFKYKCNCKCKCKSKCRCVSASKRKSTSKSTLQLHYTALHPLLAEANRSWRVQQDQACEGQMQPEWMQQLYLWSLLGRSHSKTT